MRIRQFLLFSLVLVAEFAVIEAALRIHGGSEAAPVFQQLFMPDEVVGHRLRPNTRIRFATAEYETDIAINAAGVRDEEIGPKTSDERRIVVLGDSLVMAAQVEHQETFCRLLQDRLNRQGGAGRVRVINAGVQGYGPVEEWLFFDRVVAALEPDLVIVMVFVGNDAIEAVDSAPRLDRAPSSPASEVREDAARWLRRTVRRSMVLQIVRLRVNALRDRLWRAQVSERPLATYLVDPPPDVERGLDVTKRALASIESRAAGLGARSAIVLMPARFQIDEREFQQLNEELRPIGAVLERDAASERFRSALRPLGLPMLDLLPLIRQEPDPEGLFFERNVHLTPRGHRAVAGYLERFILSEGLLDAAERSPGRLAARSAAP